MCSLISRLHGTTRRPVCDNHKLMEPILSDQFHDYTIQFSAPVVGLQEVW